MSTNTNVHFSSEFESDFEDEIPARLDTPPRLLFPSTMASTMEYGSHHGRPSVPASSSSDIANRAARSCRFPSARRRAAVQGNMYRIERRYRWQRNRLFDSIREERAHGPLFKRTRAKFRGFENLPTELILQVMKHVDVDDLPNLVMSGRAAYAVWQTSKRAIFNGIVEVQYPDFEPFFGKPDGFKSKYDSPTNASVAFGGHEDRHVENLLDNRTPKQRQNLVEAIYEDILSTPMFSRDPSRRLSHLYDRHRMIDCGGRPFLEFLQRLSSKLDLHLEALRTVCGNNADGIDTSLARPALLALWQLGWHRASQGSVDTGIPWDFEEPTDCDKIHLVLEQPNVVRDYLTRILHAIVFAVRDEMGFRTASEAFINGYKTVKKDNATAMTTSKHWVDREATALIIAFTLRTGVIGMASRVNETRRPTTDVHAEVILQIFEDTTREQLEVEALEADEHPAIREHPIITAGRAFCDATGMWWC
ncbi:hypothetical protein MMC24_005027 [Lignoscripta atroalba]|nr:hypothetical protein [Lignoscripta atroalba]